MNSTLIGSFLILTVLNILSKEAYSSIILESELRKQYGVVYSNPDIFLHEMKRIVESANRHTENPLKDQPGINLQLKRMDEIRKALKFKMDAGRPKFRNKLDPDALKNLTQLIRGKGYPVERYAVKTEDGFLLDLHRIPYGKKTGLNGRHGRAKNDGTRPVVFLQHGIICSASDWVINFANDSLGFILADHGYDVWMGNSRGNTYSQKHVSLKPEDERFWDWSFHEMAVYDTPAFIDFILTKTGQSSLYYIGHSQGTTMALAMLSLKPEYEKKIRLFIGLGPVISLQHFKSAWKYLSVFSDDMMYDIFGRKDILSHNNVTEVLVETYCTGEFTEWLCNDIIFLVMGPPDISNLNTSRVQVYLDHMPAGTSVKDFVHLSQVYKQKRFAMYDYGSSEENTKHYGNATPPMYDVSKVTVPSVLFSATNDWVADPEDVAILNSTLPNVKGAYVMDTWNHMDFLWGMDAAVKCYSKILTWLPKF